MTVTSRPYEGRVAFLALHVDVGALLEQQLDHSTTTVTSSPHEGRVAFIVLYVDVCALVE